MHYSPQAVADHFRVALGELKPSFNMAPGRSIAVVRLAPGTGRRELLRLHWGLILTASSARIDDHLIFARAEVVMHQSAYAEAFQARRCLIPADGFYEWQKEHGQKQPYFVRMRSSHLFAFGGIWGRCEDSEGQAIESCAILTTEANGLVRPPHNRMPLIVHPEHYDLWLSSQTPLEQLEPLLRPYPAREMTAYPVAETPSKAKADGPRAMEPRQQPGEETALFRPLIEELHKPKQERRASGRTDEKPGAAAPR